MNSDRKFAQANEATMKEEDIVMRTTRALAATLVAAAINAVIVAQAWSQAYPTRTIQLIVAYAAGGTGDIVARSISDKLGAALGQSVVVENRAGASGAIGAHSVTSAAPDRGNCGQSALA
jgi:tripartite-type tricarboxylate transporter receptor subunit TctC